jgi:hypothetical protein
VIDAYRGTIILPPTIATDYLREDNNDVCSYDKCTYCGRAAHVGGECASSTQSASNDQGNPILNNMGGRCQLNRLNDTAAKSVETHGYCTYTDNDGDLIFEKCDFVPAAGQGAATNNCVLTGGTGKFQGLQASIVITNTVLKSTYDGTYQSVGHKNGTYKIVKTN